MCVCVCAQAKATSLSRPAGVAGIQSQPRRGTGTRISRVGWFSWRDGSVHRGNTRSLQQARDVSTFTRFLYEPLWILQGLVKVWKKQRFCQLGRKTQTESGICWQVGSNIRLTFVVLTESSHHINSKVSIKGGSAERRGVASTKTGFVSSEPRGEPEGHFGARLVTNVSRNMRSSECSEHFLA